jgi:site-specific recombinase XerD
MQNTPKSIKTQLEDLIELWWELSKCQDLMNRLWEYAKAEGNKHLQYEKQFRGVSRQVVDLAKKLFYAMPIKVDPSHTKRLIWLILTVPLGEVKVEVGGIEMEQAVPFKKIRLEPIKSSYKKIFMKLLEEGHANNIVDSSLNDRRLYDCFIFCLEWLDKELENECKRDGTERIEPSQGAYSFYVEKKDTVFFRHFSIAIQSYFYKKVINNLESELKKRNKAVTGQVKALEKSERLSFFPPHWKVETTPTALMRDILECLEERGVENEVISEQVIREEIEQLCRKKMFCANTERRKMDEIDILVDSVKNHRTFWGNKERIDELLKDSYRDFCYKDGKEGRIEAEILSAITSETSDLESLGTIEKKSEEAKKKDGDKEFKEEYRKKAIQLSFNVHHAEGGLTRLNYHRWSSRVAGLDRVCMYLGYLGEVGRKDETGRAVFECFVESLMTGASIRKIVSNEERSNKGPGIPAGIYLSHRELVSSFFVTGEKILKEFRANVKTFNSLFPDYKIDSNTLLGAARAWHTKISHKLTPLELSFVCGSILPESKSDTHYIMPEKITESLEASDYLYVERLLKVVKIMKSRQNCLSKEEQLLTENSEKYLLQIKKTLKDRMTERNKLWLKLRPSIFFTEDSIAKNIYEKLLKNLLQEGQEPEIYFKRAGAITLFLLDVIGGYRKTELTRMLNKAVSLLTNCIIVSAKAGRSHSELRVIPLGEKSHDLISAYIKFKDDIIKNHPDILKEAKIPEKEIEKLFPMAGKVIDELDDVIFSSTGDVRNEVASLRKYAASCLHEDGVKKKLILYRILRLILGHAHAGFHQCGPFDYDRFSSLRKAIDITESKWDVKDVVGALNNWKRYCNVRNVKA